MKILNECGQLLDIKVSPCIEEALKLPYYATNTRRYSLKEYSIEELQNEIYDRLNIPRPKDCVDIDL